MDHLGAVPVSRRRYLTRREFAERHGARPGDLDAVRRFATEYGLRVGETAPERRTIQLRGAPAALERAFGVALHAYDSPSGSFRSHGAPVRVPSDLAPAIVGVFGLDSRPLLRPHLRWNADPSALGLSIPTVGTAYAFPSGNTGAGVTIGILEFGGGYSTADLQRFFTGIGRGVPSIVAVGVDGVGNAPTGDAQGPDGEVELDVEMAGALAPQARIAVYFAPNTEQGFVDALTTALHDATNQPAIVSISWGGPEESWSLQGLDALEQAAQDGAAQGVTILAAAGDQGASDGESSGALAVDFPASSPYVIGCGGTRLTLSGSSIVSEVVWNDLSQGEGATGGGVSEEFGLPSYQSASDVPDAPNGAPGRGVPDVAGNADPLTGYAVVVDGQASVIGGTSAVAPLWAALFARFAQAFGKPLGYANPLLYGVPEATAFHPITSGGNGGYSAGPGWNPCTGLGSPNGAALLAALRGEPADP